MRQKLALTALLAAALAFCQSQTRNGWESAVQQWQEKREAGLRSPDGWLTLAGLFWLEPNKPQTIGSGEDNDFVLPKGDASARIGTLRLTGSTVTFANPQGKTTTLSTDEDHPTVIHAGDVSFYAIVREGRYGIRAKDSNSPVLKNFTGTQFFPINPALHFPHAKLISDPKKIPILNILGKTDMEDSPGRVEFSYQGHTYSLRPIYEGKTLFFLFKDQTNHTDTYQLGRMLNTPFPVNGEVDLDFNRSYNPPCTFTPYATCPLAPKENTLEFPVRAGEKRYGQGHAEYSQ